MMVRTVSTRVWGYTAFTIASIWLAALAGPIVYSRMHPNPDLQKLLSALMHIQTFHASVEPSIQEIEESAGRLRRSIQLGAAWQFSKDLKGAETHSSTETQASYLAWFEKRSKPTLLIITRIEDDKSPLRFRVGEGDLSSTLVSFLIPPILFAVALYLIRKPGRVAQPQRPNDFRF